MTDKRRQGQTNHLHGLTSEDAAARHYEAQGGTCLARRAKTDAGEIDLIAQLTETLVFAEVKAARSLHAAAHALTQHQAARLGAAAEIWLAENGYPPTADIRFDLVISDRNGNLQVIENALSFDI